MSNKLHEDDFEDVKQFIKPLTCRKFCLLGTIPFSKTISSYFDELIL